MQRGVGSHKALIVKQLHNRAWWIVVSASISITYAYSQYNKKIITNN
jgi:hypothetical protein